MARLPKSIIKKYGITKKAWSVFRGQRKGRKKGKRTTKRSGRKTGRRSFFSTNTVFKFLRLTALLAPAAGRMMEPRPPDYKIKAIIEDYTGYSINAGDFQWSRLSRGWMPYLVSVVVTNGIQKLSGIIRRL